MPANVEDRHTAAGDGAIIRPHDQLRRREALQDSSYKLKLMHGEVQSCDIVRE
jgi:hypothetical protein